MDSLLPLLRDIFLPIHIVSGFLALGTFWLPTLSKKGRRLHRLSGKLYVWLMWSVVISAATLCLIKVLDGQWVGASFLGFLALITSQPLWYGIAVLRYKREVPLRLLRIRRVLHGLVALFGVAMLITALYLRLEGQAILLLIFGLLGASSIREVLKPLGDLQAAAHWLTDHLEGMVVTGIAAHTAFFAFGGYRFFGGIFTGPWVAIPWIMPTIIGVVAMSRMKRKWQKGVV